MFGFFHKKQGLSLVGFSCLLVSLTTLFSFFGVYYSQGLARELHTSSETVDFASSLPTIVIDAGHGGEDGGASTYGGAPEKELNLLIANDLRDMLLALGINVIMTRTDDSLLYDKSSDYKGHKKSMDLANRLKIAKEAERPILISIHMNAFPEEKYSGLQVYYSKNAPDSAKLAKAVQDLNKALLSPQNNRKTKPAGSNIYLLDRFEYPAILIECGFLSNPEERDKLNTESYQKELAACFFVAILQYLSK